MLILTTLFALLPVGLLLGGLLLVGKLISKPDTMKSLFTPDYPALVTGRLGVVIGLVVVGFNIFLYDLSSKYRASLGLLGFVLIMNLSWLLLIEVKKRNWLFWGCLTVSVISSAMTVIRSNSFVLDVNSWMILITQGLLYFLLVFDRIEWSALWLAKNWLRFEAKLLGLPFNRQSRVDAQSVNRSLVTRILLTLLITLILGLVFVGIFSSADLVFAKLIKEYMDQVLPRSLTSIVVGVLALWWLSLRQKADQENRFSLEKWDFYYLFVPLLTVAVITGLFLVVQAKYLFADQAAFKALEISYSEYVRQGFMELLVAAFLGGILSYVLALKQRQMKIGLKTLWLKVLGSGFVIEMWLLLLSAFKRDLMYIDVYGVTRVRIIGGVFLVWLFGVLLLMLIMNLKQSFKENRFFVGVAIVSLVVWGYLNVVDVDQSVIASAPGHHKYTDHFYLANLAYEHIDTWQTNGEQISQKLQEYYQLTNLTDIQRSELAGLKLALISYHERSIWLLKKYMPVDWQLQHFEELYDVHQYGEKVEIIKKELGDWRVWNWVESEAAKRISAQPDYYLVGINRKIEEMESYQTKYGFDLYAQEHRLLHEFKYPFMEMGLDYNPRQFSSYSDYELSLPSNYAKFQSIMNINPYQVDITTGDWLKNNGSTARFIVIAQRPPENYFLNSVWTNYQDRLVLIADNSSMAAVHGGIPALLPQESCGSCTKNSLFGSERTDKAMVAVELKTIDIEGVNVLSIESIEEYKYLQSK